MNEYEEIDKKTTNYFMTKMTQQEFDEIRKLMPISDEKYVMNKIRRRILFR